MNRFALSACLLILLSPVQASAQALRFADVTPSAGSVVWVLPDAMSSASVQVFDDTAGTSLSAGVVQDLTSSPESLALGIARVDVGGLSPDTCYAIRALSSTAAGTIRIPAAPPFPELCTTSRARRDSSFGQPIANDLLRHDVVSPGIGTAAGAIVLVDAPDLGGHPVSAVADDGFGVGEAVANLNNLTAGATGENVAVAAGTRLVIEELRGNACPPSSAARLRFGRAPAHEEAAVVGVAISQVEPPDPCFFADTDCDGLVAEADAQRVFDVFDSEPTECAFDPDLDVVADDRIDILDVQSVLNRLGESAP